MQFADLEGAGLGPPPPPNGEHNYPSDPPGKMFWIRAWHGSKSKRMSLNMVNQSTFAFILIINNFFSQS